MSGRIMLDEADALPEEPRGPPAQPPAPEPEPSPTPAAEPEPEGDTQPSSKEAEDAEAAAKLKERIDQLTREKWEARRDAERYAARVAELQQPPPQPGTQQDPVEVAKAQLRQEAAVVAFNTACNATFAKGKAEYPAFAAEVDALNAVGAANRGDFLQAVTQLPDGHRIYHQLAGNLDEAARILTLPPMAMAVELARMSLADAGSGNGAAVAEPAPAPVSRAPAPIRPIGGGSRSPPRLANVTMAEFIRMRDKEELERRGR